MLRNSNRMKPGLTVVVKTRRERKDNKTTKREKKVQLTALHCANHCLNGERERERK